MMVHRLVLATWLVSATAFSPSHLPRAATGVSTGSSCSSSSSSSSRRPHQHQPLFVSIGLGPQQQDDRDVQTTIVKTYEIPHHEDYRTSRRSKIDEQSDAWFGRLLNSRPAGCCAGALADQARAILTTPVPLENDLPKPLDHPEWTPYVTTKLPWTPLTPAFGLEEFGLPTPRRNAETWRHFDVPGLVSQDYSAATTTATAVLVAADVVRQQLQQAGGWLSDDACTARLVYINGQFVSELSKTTDYVYNLNHIGSDTSPDIIEKLARLTDGFTDTLAAPVPSGADTFLTSFGKLSVPDHNMGPATSQFAINTQQGTACFAALNTIQTAHVAVVTAASGTPDDDHVAAKPVLIVNARTPSGGAVDTNSDDDDDDDAKSGVAMHPRTLVIAPDYSRLSVVQSCVDVGDSHECCFKPKLYNGYTQVFVGAHANVTHSYLEETGGMVTPGVEKSDEEWAKEQQQQQQQQQETSTPRQVEAQRPQLKDSHLEAMDVHITGANGAYQGTVMSLGGSGRVRICHSITLLQPGAHAQVNGFSLTGGTQRTDMKTNIHHVAAGTTSRQVQKSMIGGRGTGAFRGRIRVEQSAQQTDSSQLSRTILLSDKARAWAVPSLEIIADDVQCAHGATVSDLSEEELFYLRSRGLDVAMSRNLLMYAFAGDISASVDPAMLGQVDSSEGLQKRVIRKLENLVPRGQRAVKGEFQSI